MKPSEEIWARFLELDKEFKEQNPFFYTDFGYWPDFRFRAACEWLDKFVQAKEPPTAPPLEKTQ
jgi:hypothetical protein